MAVERRHDAEACPCGSGRALSACCKPFLDGQAIAPTAESADAQPLQRLRPRPGRLPAADLASGPSARRSGSRCQAELAGTEGIATSSTAQEGDNEGVVEFVARFKIAGRGHRLHEISRFEKVDGRWLYLDGARGSTDSSLRS